MKVAFSIWNGRISPLFDTSTSLWLVDVKEGELSGGDKVYFASEDPGARVGRLAELGVEELVCGAISKPLSDMLAASGIKTHSFIGGELDTVCAAYLAGTLMDPSLSLPGCCRGNRARSRRRCGRSGKGFGKDNF